MGKVQKKNWRSAECLNLFSENSSAIFEVYFRSNA